MIELKNIFKTKKLKIYSDNFFDLKNGKVCLGSNDKYFIYEDKYFNRLFEIKIQELNGLLARIYNSENKEIKFMIELDNNDLVIYNCYNLDNFFLDIYRLDHNVYYLLQRNIENSYGHNSKLLGDIIYHLKKVIKLKKNKFTCISSYGIKIYSLDDDDAYSIILINDFGETIQDVFQIEESKFIFFISKYANNLNGKKYIIEKVDVNKITEEEKNKRLTDVELWFIEKKYNKEIIEKVIDSLKNLKLTISRKKVFERYTSFRFENWKFQGFYLKEKYFIASLSNHLLIFNLLNFELIKDFILFEEIISEPIFISGNRPKIGKILKYSNDNEFLLFWDKYIYLFILNEINLNEKQTLTLNVIAYFDNNSFKHFRKFNENKFYIFDKHNDNLSSFDIYI